MDAQAPHFSKEKLQTESKTEAGRQTTCTQDNNNPYQVGFVAAQDNETGISNDTIDVATYIPNDAVQYNGCHTHLINAAQVLLKRENLMVSGLQNLILGMFFN